MTDPPLDISGAFNPVIEEGWQHSLGAGTFNLFDSMAFTTSFSTEIVAATTNAGWGMWDCPICTHRGVLGHQVDRCYKLHGHCKPIILIIGFWPKELRAHNSFFSFAALGVCIYPFSFVHLCKTHLISDPNHRLRQSGEQRKKERKEKGEGGGNREEPEKVSARENL